MNVDFYLVVNRNGTIKTLKSKPGLNWDEISIKVNLKIPDMLFQKPQLVAYIEVPNNAAMPREIGVAIQDNIKEAIESAAGLDVKLIIEDQRSEETNP